MAKKRKTKRNPYDLSAVMRAIFSRGDVPHKTLVLMRRRAVTIGAAAKLDPGLVAFTMLALLERNWEVAMILGLDDGTLIRWSQSVRVPDHD